MTIEERLKELILTRYKSIREFTQVIDMSYSTMDSILRRGVGNSSVTNIIKICKALGISADELAEGNIVHLRPFNQNISYGKQPVEIDDIFLQVKNYLYQNPNITIDGETVDMDTIKAITNTIDIGVALAKKNFKEQK